MFFGLEFPASASLALTSFSLMTSALIPSPLGTVLQLKMAFANLNLRVLFDTAEMCVRVNYLFFALIRPGSPGCRHCPSTLESLCPFLRSFLLFCCSKPNIQTHLVKVYSALAGTVLAAVIGTIAHMLFNLGMALFWYFPSPHVWLLHFFTQPRANLFPPYHDQAACSAPLARFLR
jgi:hypothetical protein